MYNSAPLLVGKDVQVLQFLDDLTFPPVLDPLHGTGLQVTFQQDTLKFLDGAVHCVGLLEYVDAVLLFFYHLPNTGKVAVDLIQSLQGLGLYVR